MKKISKISLALSSLYIMICSKVFGIPLPNDVPVLYGITKPNLQEKAIQVVPVLLPIILFIIGFFVFINKKIAKNIKIIIIAIFIIIITIEVITNLI
jgi:hypothetical protein